MFKTNTRHSIAIKIKLALELQNKGRLIEAEKIFKEVLKLEPVNIDALHLLGVNYFHLKNFDSSIEYISKAIKRNCNNAMFHFHLGNVYYELKIINKALDSYLSAIEINPNYANAHNNIGCINRDLRNYDDAIKAFEKVAEIEPNNVRAFYNLGNAYSDTRFFSKAIACLIKAIDIDPMIAECYDSLGFAYVQNGQLVEAMKCCYAAIKLNPKLATAHANCALIHEKKGEFADAIKCINTSVSLDPNNGAAYNTLGNIQRLLDHPKESEASFKKSILLNPDNYHAYNNIGVLFMSVGRYAESEYFINKAIRLEAHHPGLLVNLAGAIERQGRIDEALQTYRRAIILDSKHLDARANLLFAMHYSSTYNKSEWLLEAKSYGRLIQVQQPFIHHKKINKKVKLGFVSGDLKAHPVGFFGESLFKNINKNLFEIIAYPTIFKTDETTVKLRAYFDRWIPIGSLTIEEAANQIKSDDVDILFDLSGHTEHNRLEVFAFKPAPIQVTWLGYFATTGLEQIDYILGDPHVTPKEEADNFVEKIWQLPESYVCFSPPEEQIDVLQTPFTINRFTTFGCFNNSSKINDDVIALWSDVLKSIPNSKLFLKSKQMGDPVVTAQFKEKFAAHAIKEDQLIFEGNSPRSRLLFSYNYIDIALDPFPYPGGTTSAEALWMGVPVLTLKGDRFLSHVGESIVRNAGMPQWIAQNKTEYIAKAVEFSTEMQKNSNFKRDLRQKVLHTPLFDGERFTANFEIAILGMVNAYNNTVEGT